MLFLAICQEANSTAVVIVLLVVVLRYIHNWFTYTLVNCYIAIGHGHRNSGFTQLQNGGSFHSYVTLLHYVNLPEGMLYLLLVHLQCEAPVR